MLEKKNQTKRMMIEKWISFNIRRNLRSDRLNSKRRCSTRGSRGSVKTKTETRFDGWYKESSYRKQQIQQMKKQKAMYDHQNFINHVDFNHQKSIQNHHQTVDKHLQYREVKNAIGYAPVDERLVQKEKAVESMKKYYEQREQEQERKKQLDQNHL